MRAGSAFAGALALVAGAVIHDNARACVVAGPEPVPPAIIIVGGARQVPPVEVSGLSIRRGKSTIACGYSSSCDDLGLIAWKVALSDGTPPCALGYEYELVSGAVPAGLTLPRQVGARCAPEIAAGGMILVWIDELRNDQDPFSFDLGIRAVDATGRKGPQTVLRIADDGRAQPLQCTPEGDGKTTSADGAAPTDGDPGGGGCSYARARAPASALMVLLFVLAQGGTRKRGSRPRLIEAPAAHSSPR